MDPFGHADAVLDKKIHRPSSDQVQRSELASGRSQHLVDKPSEESSSISGGGKVPDLVSPTATTKAVSDATTEIAPIAVIDKKASPGKPSHTALPSLTPHKADLHAAAPIDTTMVTTTDSSTTEVRDLSSGRQSHRRHSGGSQDAPLTVRVDHPSDAPMSNPPTVTAMTPHSTQKRSSSATASSLAEEVAASPLSPTGRSGSIGNASSKDISNRFDDGSRRLLKKTTSSFEMSPTPLPGGRSQTNHDRYIEKSPSPTKRDHRMPSWLSPHGSSDLTGGGSPATSRDATVRQLQQKVDELSVQKETIEKYLRLEIDTLKSQLDHSLSGGGGNFDSSGGRFATHELDDLRQRVRELTKENMDLKEESTMDKIRHQKEITHLRERHQADIDAGNASRTEELSMLDRRHSEAITALKKIHADEIAAIKQRAKDGAALEQLTSQITSTTGSLKLIEEQMSLQYRGIDVVREGQFEARERLLLDMEAKARERAEAAETEGYKLKGLLHHMEQVHLPIIV